MTIQIKALTLGMVATNCYIIGDQDSGKAVLIDPVDRTDLILQTLDESGWQLEMILATHGHFDHVLASQALKEATGAPFLINQHDQPLLDNLPETGLRFIGERFPKAADPDRYLTDTPETLEVGAIKLETLFTPGHAPGHISFVMQADTEDGSRTIVLSGDCLFQGSIGRTDLPGADYHVLMRSIFDKLIPLGDDTLVLPGHGGQTTIGHERRTNPFLTDYQAT